MGPMNILEIVALWAKSAGSAIEKPTGGTTCRSKTNAQLAAGLRSALKLSQANINESTHSDNQKRLDHRCFFRTWSPNGD